MKRFQLVLMFLMLGISSVSAQTIDFETVNGSKTEAGQSIKDEYANQTPSVTFSLVDDQYQPITNAMPVIAEVGDTAPVSPNPVAFGGPTPSSPYSSPGCVRTDDSNQNRPASSEAQKVKCSFLTFQRYEGGKERRLLIRFGPDTKKLGLGILDIDGGEAWRIRLYGTPNPTPASSTISDFWLCSPGFGSPNCNEKQSTEKGDGLLTDLTIEWPGIRSMVIEYDDKKTSGANVYLSIDNVFAESETEDEKIVQSITDGNFESENWTTEVCPGVLGTDNATFSAVKNEGDGNPAPSYAIRHEYDLRIAVCHINNTGVLASKEKEIDAITFEWESKLLGKIGTMAIRPLIKQGDTYYWADWQATRTGGFTKRTKTLTASDFTPIYSSAGSSNHPDFSCGSSPLEVGVVSANQTGVGTTAVGALIDRDALMDNWSVKSSVGNAC